LILLPIFFTVFQYLKLKVNLSVDIFFTKYIYTHRHSYVRTLLTHSVCNLEKQQQKNSHSALGGSVHGPESTDSTFRQKRDKTFDQTNTKSTAKRGISHYLRR